MPPIQQTGLKPMVRNLFLDTIDETFDGERDVVFGPYCFLGSDDQEPGWQKRTFIDPFVDESVMLETQRQVARLVNWHMKRLSEKLNARHGTNHAIDFWRLIALSWLIELTQRAWTSYVTFQEIIEVYGNDSLNVIVCPSVPQLRFENTEYYIGAQFKDYDYNWWLDSEVAAHIIPPHWRLVKSSRDRNKFTPVERKPAPPAPGYLRLLMRSLKYRIGYSDIVGIRFSGLLLAIYTSLLPKSPSRQRFQPDTEFNPKAFFPGNFLTVLDHLIEETMPVSLGDGFAELAANASKLTYMPGRLRLGTLDLWNDREKVIAAYAREAGEKLVVCQHGGLYGIVKYSMLTYEIEYKNNIFINWGWSVEEDTGTHMLSLPGPYLSKLADRHRRANDNIIVVGNPIRMRLGRISWQPRTTGNLRYCEHMIKFLETFKTDVRDKVVFRPYVPTASDIDIGHVVNKQFPDLPMLETSLHEAMLSCRLLVLSNCGTTLNLAMAANIPTIVFWHGDFLPPRKEAAPYFEALKKCGILFEDSEKAAEHINGISDDVEGWWNSKEVQDARQAWANQYAKTDRLWWWQWMKALAKLKNVG